MSAVVKALTNPGDRAPKDTIQITWERLPDLISILRRIYNDKKEFLSDAEIEELKFIFSYYEQIQFAVRERIRMSPMTYDALNHPDEEYLKSIYPSDVIKNMPFDFLHWIGDVLSNQAYFL